MPTRTVKGFAGALLCAGVTLGGVPALAAYDDAWIQLRIDVETACLEAAKPLFAFAWATVDPFGSQRYGLALIHSTAFARAVMAICVYDKETGTVEIGSEMPGLRGAYGGSAGDILRANMEPCPDPCPIGPPLAEADAAVIRSLPARINATLGSLGADGWGPWGGDSQLALGYFIGRERPGDLAAIAPGERDCVVYWYGFLDEDGREVGRHRCTVEEGPDGLVLSKTTGEMMRAILTPLAPGTAIAIGRTYLDDHTERTYDAASPDNAANPNFGNYAGVAFAVGETLVIVDADMHGFDMPDPSYFAMLVVEPPE